MTINFSPPIAGNIQTEDSAIFRKDSESELLIPSSPNEFLPRIGLWTSLGGIFLLAIFGAAITLSNVFNYKVTVQAAAAIRPVGELRLVQSAIEGSIASIQVKENQTVKTGDIIATLDDSRLKTKLSQLEGDLRKGRQQVVAINFQILALNRQIAAEMEQTDRAVAGVRAELSRYQREYRDKQITSKAQVAESVANFLTAKKERQAAAVELSIGDAHLKFLQAAAKAAIAKRDRYKSAASAGAISRNQLEEAELAAEQQFQAVVEQQATINKNKQIVAKLQHMTEAAKARHQQAMAALNPSTADLKTIVAKIARERASGNAAIARLQKEREQLLQQRGEIKSQLDTNRAEIKQVTTELKGTIVRASASGIIQDLSLRNNSQVVRPGDRLAQIAPSDAPLTIKAAVSSGDINKVKVGQPVQMRVSACPYPDYGVLSGKVSQISPDAKVPDQGAGSPRQGEVTATSMYYVTVKPDVLTLKNGVAECPIQPGMEGRADIISKEETVLQFMLRTARILVSP